MSEIEEKLLGTLQENGVIDDTGTYARENGWEHNDGFVGVLKKLSAHEVISLEILENRVLLLTPDGEDVLANGSYEARVFNAVPPGEAGLLMADLDKLLGNLAKIGLGAALSTRKWLRLDKPTGRVIRTVETIEDHTKNLLVALREGANSLAKNDIEGLKKGRLVNEKIVKTFKVSKGTKFSPKFRKAAADLTHEMLTTGTWQDETFKEYNFNAMGIPPSGGYLHPLMKVRAEYREIFLEMGFEEMPTSRYVENSFWNFDTLFQPQQHPARDAHDTFFLADPATSQDFPQDYLARVKEVHTNGGFGSTGWRYDWKIEEAKKNILRTHTTAVSSRMLYKLAQGGFTPKKYFSIDRVFRNETLDATHLAEFHQIEGLVADYNITLANLFGIISLFFKRLGINDIRFKPAYNPYTEPSMEIFGYHPLLKKWVELGNSGMFRPEMLRPMGLPENVRVIAWGLSLERPTMIKYKIANIRDIFGPKIDLNFIKQNPMCFIHSPEST